MPKRRLAGRALVLLTCLTLIASGPGCAAMTGLVTGAFTGAVDAPAQVYRHNRAPMNHHPEYWAFNVLLMGPVGFASGALAGFIKGLSLDVQWLIGRVRYDRVFTSYKKQSIWRPFTIHW